jgi:hypothetical protein
MSNLLEKASLVYIPSGYKEDTAYSVIPTDGSGDIQFTRASDGTRVNSAGYVENVPWNLFQYSNDFSNVAWTKYNATLTSGQSDPFGGTNAWKFEAIISAQADFRQTVSGANSYSFYAKAGTSPEFRLWSGTSGTIFNLSTGTISSGSGIIESVGNGWYRCTILTSTSASVTLIPYFVGNAGDYIYVAFGQAQTTTTAKPYFPTTDRQNVPRLTYEGGCPSLLLEPQRTNLVTYSEQFDNAAWPKLAASVLANDTTSPDGTQNADKMRPNSGLTFSIAGSGAYTIGSGSYVRSSALTLTAASYTFSAFVKKGEYDHVQFRSGTNIDTTSGATAVLVNLNNGTIVGSTGTASSIEDFGNGWYRVSHTFTATASTWYLNFWFWNTTSVTSNGTDGIYIWGAQLEAGSYPTSYIPTTSASVTRVADAASKTGISSLIGQTEGTIYWNGTIDNFSNFATLLSLEGVSNSWIYFLSYSGGLTFEVRSNNIVSASYVSASTTGAHKIALAYNASQVDIYIDGVSVYTDYSVTIPATSNLYLAGWSGYNQSIKTSQALLFKTRLTNAELASLTTL